MKSSMKSSSISKTSFPLSMVLSCLILFLLGMVYFAGAYKWLTILVGVIVLILLIRRDLSPVLNLPSLCLLGYVVFSGLTSLWAMSGKFFLREYSKIFVACGIFLAIALSKRFDRVRLQQIMSVLAGISALIAVLSVEAASTGMTGRLLSVFPGMQDVPMGFEAGTRLTGIFGNANISASILAVGILFSLALLCGVENKRTRSIYAALLSLNAFAFLLSFSMGGIASFALAVVAYLIFAGESRGAALVRMLEGAVPTLLCAFAAFPFFNQSGMVHVIPLLAMAINLLVVVLLEQKAAPALTARLEGRQKLTFRILIGVILLAVLYGVVGYHLYGPYTFGDSLRRSAYPQSGEHTMSVEATGEVEMEIISQDMSQIMMHTNTVIYRGPADQAVFTVPENSEVCYFTFRASEGTTIQHASIDGVQSIRLDYTLFPNFVANRIQGLWANQNAIQRMVFFKDGLRLVSNSPVLGNGVGAFETGVTSVQDFYYETRYIHNHYIQVLLESGIIGLALFAGALVTLVAALWKRRKEDGPFQWAYPALWAGLVMTAAHAATEVSMSMIFFLCYAFALFALILRTCVPKGRMTEKKVYANVARVVCTTLPALFLLSLGGNLAAIAIAQSPASTPEQLLSHLSTSTMLDPYEKNDFRLSYLRNVWELEMESYADQANRYAEDMMEEQSNAIPQTLVDYYLATGQYEKACQAAMNAAVYSASDHKTWNAVIDSLRYALIDRLNTPLLTDPAPILQGMTSYYQALQHRNQTSMEPIALTTSSQDFFSKLLTLSAQPVTPEKTFLTLYTQLFSSQNGCDADGNFIHDQITGYGGASFGTDGAVTLEADGEIKLRIYAPIPVQAQLTIQCQNPGQLVVRDLNSKTVFKPEVNGEEAFFSIPLELANQSELELQISSSAPQTLNQIQMERSI